MEIYVRIEKPVLAIIGHDGNAFAILAAARKAARRAGWTDEQIAAMTEKATSGDYDDLLRTMMDYFDVC